MYKTSDEPSELSPGDHILRELDRRGWGQDDLARVIGRPASRINEMIRGKLAISPEVAAELSAALGGTPEEWLQRESVYRLSLVEPDTEAVRRRAKLYELAPVKEMQRRGWITESTDSDKLEADVLGFFGIPSVDHQPVISAAPRKTDSDQPLSPGQRAWCFRAKQLASALVMKHRFDSAFLAKCERELRILAAYPQEGRKAPNTLAKYGIRYVVVEPLPSTKIDGATFWLDAASPVIAMSIRYDRIDGFWFTLMHEFRHIVNGDGMSADAALVGPDREPECVKSAIERRADTEAGEALIKAEVMKDFMARVGPMYSRDRIVQFAHTIKIHPGIIVGQLQHRGEVSYGSHKDLLAKIRSIITQSSVTDGWGHSVQLEKTK